MWLCWQQMQVNQRVRLAHRSQTAAIKIYMSRRWWFFKKRSNAAYSVSGFIAANKMELSTSILISRWEQVCNWQQNG